MNIDTWAVVLATAFGPIAAVIITLWRDSVFSKRERKLQVFRTLMATRKVGLSQDHVNALNLVEIDFYGKALVQSSWLAYKAHLDSPTGDVRQWAEKKETLLAKLLSEMATSLKFDFKAIDIFKGGYAPSGWEAREHHDIRKLEFFDKIYEGSTSFPISIFDVPNDTKK